MRLRRRRFHRQRTQFVAHLEPHLLDLHEEGVEFLGVHCFVRQIIVDLREREITLLAAELGELPQTIVKRMHD
jgi:hypothetical protein